MNRNKKNPQDLSCVEGQKSPVSPLPVTPAIVVIVVIAVFISLIVTGMPVEAAGITVGTGGLLGIELVRRLVQMIPLRRTL
ncbi:hypothetical protein ABZ990_00715 [Streptomyces sp. NPDC046203]|uniref:hypothetical protein n=1 Tax=Streptomyces sp. NPDC046203 TaxID=3154602 RepID=UPI00340CD665